MAQGLQNALGAQVGAADAAGDHQVYAFLHPLVADGFIVVEFTLGDLAGEFLPAQEIVSGAGLVLEHIEGVESLGYVSLILLVLDKGGTAFNIYFDHIYT